ncbi:hypothetical protein [Hymenobacter sp.]|uniref:hypothetical protein n=1 Tax=Hymenobacter sp. TaxID=1898978 RepID=UPI00286AACA8|nr:hypothetical protein [Hymenobacter sp.]
MTEKQKFLHLLAFVCEDLSTDAVNKAVRSGHEASATQLMAVRHGRIMNLKLLVDLVRIGLPEYEVPADLLPAQKPQLT